MILLVHSSLTRLLMSDRSLKSKLLRPLHKIETSRRNVQTAQGSADPGASSSVAAAPASSSQAQHAQQAPSKEEEEERRGLVCMVCKEGYASRPKELLQISRNTYRHLCPVHCNSLLCISQVTEQKVNMRSHCECVHVAWESCACRGHWWQDKDSWYQSVHHSRMVAGWSSTL